MRLSARLYVKVHTSCLHVNVRPDPYISSCWRQEASDTHTDHTSVRLIWTIHSCSIAKTGRDTAHPPDKHPLVCKCEGHTQSWEPGGRGAAGIPCGGAGKASSDTGGDTWSIKVFIRRTPRCCSAYDLRRSSSRAVSCHS